MGRREGRIGFWEAFSIGVGGMIGGGIFAVLGLSIQLSHGGAPIAFLLAGLIALTTAYSYAKLSRRYPSEGGTIEFLVRAFGTGVLTGGLNVMLLASYVVMISLYSYAFGSYGASLVGPNNPILKHALITLVIIAFTVVNALGAVISGRAEDALVGFKLAILVLVVGAGLLFVDWGRIGPSNWPGPVSLVAGGMIIFLAYEGFELIANAGQDVEDPDVLPKAFYSAVLVVITVYVLVAVVTVGNLPYDVILKARDYALAMAAKPSLGQAGFVLVAAAALASTSSAINATLYGTARASYMVAKYGQLPKAVEKPLWRQAYEGLVMISIASLILANTADLEEISAAGSGGFLLIFLTVNLAALKLRRETRANPVVAGVGAAATAAALAILTYRMVTTAPEKLVVFVAVLVTSFIIEYVYRKATGREIAEFIDHRLRQREENIRRWFEWVPKLVHHIKQEFRDAEVYIVGSLARGEEHAAHDVDILVVTENPPRSPEEEREVLRRVKERAELTPQHPADIHFTHKRRKEESLRRAKHYREVRPNA